MNTAARLNQQALSQNWVLSFLLSQTQLLTIALVMAILMSSMSMIYVTHLTRNLNANIQQSLAERNALHIQWAKLLLEKSTWVMQARVQHIAEAELNMSVPENKSVVIINE